MDDAQIAELLRPKPQPKPTFKPRRRSLLNVPIGTPIRPRSFWGAILAIPLGLGVVVVAHEFFPDSVESKQPAGGFLIWIIFWLARSIVTIPIAIFRRWQWEGRSRRVLGDGAPVKQGILFDAVVAPVGMLTLILAWYGAQHALSPIQLELMARSWEFAVALGALVIICTVLVLKKLLGISLPARSVATTKRVKVPRWEIAWWWLGMLCIYLPIKWSAGLWVSCMGMVVACAITLSALRTVPTIIRAGRRWGTRSRRVLGARRPVSLLPGLFRGFPAFVAYICVADVSRTWFGPETVSQSSLDLLGMMAALFVAFVTTGDTVQSRRINRPWRQGQMAHPDWY